VDFVGLKQKDNERIKVLFSNKKALEDFHLKSVAQL
jgi:hypothetical protein